MEFLVPSFLAGLLTILAPCTLSLLPVILGGTVGEKNPWKPLIISGSLGISVILFTILLKGTTTLLNVPQEVWRWISGGLIVLFGLTMVFPSIWEKLAFKLKLYKSENLLEKSSSKKGIGGSILLGASLGPVFSTCSPTYAIVLAIVLPANFGVGVINIVVYGIGLVIPLLIIGYGGQKVSKKFRFAANPRGWFKRSLGALLLITGLFIFTGFDKTIEKKILEAGYLGPIGIENSIVENQRT